MSLWPTSIPALSRKTQPLTFCKANTAISQLTFPCTTCCSINQFLAMDYHLSHCPKQNKLFRQASRERLTKMPIRRDPIEWEGLLKKLHRVSLICLQRKIGLTKKSCQIASNSFKTSYLQLNDLNHVDHHLLHRLTSLTSLNSFHKRQISALMAIVKQAVVALRATLITWHTRRTVNQCKRWRANKDLCIAKSFKTSR